MGEWEELPWAGRAVGGRFSCFYFFCDGKFVLIINKIDEIIKITFEE